MDLLRPEQIRQLQRDETGFPRNSCYVIDAQAQICAFKR